MNESVPTAARASWRQRLAKGAVLSAAIAVGVATAQLLPSPSAFAAGMASMHGGGEPSAEMRERHHAMMHDHVQRVLTADPGTGVMRHADAGYPEALAAAREGGLDLPSVG